MCYIFSIIIDLSSLNKAGFIYKLYYSFISIRNYLEYIVIIVYLLAKLPTQLSTQANNKENVPVSPNNSNPNFMQQPKFTINNPNTNPSSTANQVNQQQTILNQPPAGTQGIQQNQVVVQQNNNL